MAKSGRTPSEILRNKKDKLDWERFHFLENLLVFCASPSRTVPPESGVCFRIGRSTPWEDEICLLFHIDRTKDPLVRERETKRPDYLVFYVSPKIRTCICTIIEMKGRSGKNLGDGVDQIKSLRNILNEEMSKHLPTRFKVVFQGILLTPPNSDIPREKLLKTQAEGLVIVPLQHPSKANLYPYVSKLNRLTDKYRHEEARRDAGTPAFNFLEDLLTGKCLPERLNDSFHERRFPRKKRAEAEGIHLNYLLSDSDDYAVMKTDGKTCTIGIREPNSEHRDRLRVAIEQIGVDVQRHFRFERIDRG